MVYLRSCPQILKEKNSMQKILKIARLELSVLFYSPIAWIILAIIFLQAGLNYTDTLYTQETQQQLERPLTVVTRVLFAGDKGMLSALIEYLYLYIPLLTMGIFSREYNNGSIKLLQSSPVTPWQIVLGKYLSIVFYVAIVLLLLSIFIVSAFISVENMDWKFVCCGLFALFLLMCSYAAIGLFMSSLTSYQIVAAISTLALLALLNYAPVLGEGYDGLREITHWLSIGGRAEEIVNGLLTTRELIYFGLIISFFLSLTVLRMVQERSGLSLQKRCFQYLGLVVSMLGIGYISSLPSLMGYYDTTQVKDRTLSAKGQEIAARITDPIKLISFVNVLDFNAAYGAPKNRMTDINRFAGYQRFLPQLKMEYIAYYDSVPNLQLDSNETMLSKAQKSADALGFNFKKLLTPVEMKQYPALAVERNSFVRYIEYQGKSTPLRMYNDLWQYPTETEISAALLRLLDGPARVAVLTGHGERDIVRDMDVDYSLLLNGPSLRASVINQGFSVDKLEIDALADFDGVCLLIADPKEAYSATELTAIFNYIDKGGNVFLLADLNSATHLQPIAEKLGLQFMAGTLLQESDNFELDLLRLHLTPQARDKGYGFYDGALVVMNKAVGIRQLEDNQGFSCTVIVGTDESNSWNKTSAFDLATEKVVFDPLKDTYSAVPTAIQLERKQQAALQKVFVMGDADFISNSELTRFNISSINTSLATRIFKWFSDGKYPVSGKKEKAIDLVIKVDRANINLQKIILLFLIPAGIAGTAMFVLRRRKRN